MPTTGEGRLRTADLARLVAWKLRKSWRHAVDVHGGYRRLEQRGVRWAAEWCRRHGRDPSGLQQWLTRSDAGVFWFPVRDAADWARRGCTSGDVQIAAAVAEGRFDLLGSGPVDLGGTPAWRRDLYSGNEWPPTEASRVPLFRHDGSDIRTVWELSRCYHFLALARAYWCTGDERYRRTFVRHVTSWLAQNPVGYGPHWASPMDAAIRAANWTLALVLFAPAREITGGFWERMLANLYATGLFLERYPEWHPVYRGNHFVAGGVGLVYLGTLFRDSPDGGRWLRQGGRLLNEEIERQVSEDGVSFEAALGYHRMVTEFFTYGGELLRRNLPSARPPRYDVRLRRMYEFMAAYLPDSGEAPMLGDGDDGRLHALSAEGFAAPRRHRLGLPDHDWPRTEPVSAAFPGGGFYVMRRERDHLVVRCGPVGVRGAGSHDHNDQLSFELVVGGRRLVADSGTYTYTRDLAMRHAFRRTAAHNVVQLGDEEQNPIEAGRPWRLLADRTRAECLRWESVEGWDVFEGRHSGYAHRPSGAVCRRRITALWREQRWEVVDEIDGNGAELLTWRLHLAPTALRQLASANGRREFLAVGDPPVRLTLELPPGMELQVAESAASDRYGTRYTRPLLEAAGVVALPVRITTTFAVVRD